MRKREDIKTRLLRHVRKDPETGCWEWTGSLFHDGYGQIWSGDYTEKGGPDMRGAHRVMWKYVNGDPGDLCVLHKCDNRLCVNPEHLFLGTHADNRRDMCAKGRDVKSLRCNAGEKNPQSKLTEDKVLEIRKSRLPAKDLALKYGISLTQVYKILNRAKWTHI
jgi:hypothetical protein